MVLLPTPTQIRHAPRVQTACGKGNSSCTNEMAEKGIPRQVIKSETARVKTKMLVLVCNFRESTTESMTSPLPNRPTKHVTERATDKMYLILIGYGGSVGGYVVFISMVTARYVLLTKKVLLFSSKTRGI